MRNESKCMTKINKKHSNQELKLFNFGNLSSTYIIKNVFAKIAPEIYNHGIVLNLNYKMTFFDFFEAFVLIAEESVKIKKQEINTKMSFIEVNKVK